MYIGPNYMQHMYFHHNLTHNQLWNEDHHNQQASLKKKNNNNNNYYYYCYYYYIIFIIISTTTTIITTAATTVAPLSSSAISCVEVSEMELKNVENMMKEYQSAVNQVITATDHNDRILERASDELSKYLGSALDPIFEIMRYIINTFRHQG